MDDAQRPFDSQHFRILAESASDAIITIDADSTVLFVNPASERIFGYRREELIGRDLTMLMPDYLREIHRQAVSRYVATGRRHISWEGLELPGIHRDGRLLALEVSFGESVVRGSPIFTGIIRDVSERKQLERRRDAQYAVTRVLAESTELGVATWRLLQVIGESIGWEFGELWLLDRGERELRHQGHWSARPEHTGEFEERSEGMAFASGVGLPGRVWASGEALWVADVVRDPSYPRAALAATVGLHGAFAFPVRSRGRLVGVFCFYSRRRDEPDSDLIRLMEAFGSQLGDFIERLRIGEEREQLLQQLGVEQGRLRRLNESLERRVGERTAQLEAANRELDAFAYSVSHDLRAPLRGIDGFSRALLEDYEGKLDAQALRYLGRIRVGVKRMADLIDDLLGLARLSADPLETEEVDLSALARDVIAELERNEPEREVAVVVADGVRVLGDARLLRIVLENLFQNAWKFTRRSDGGEVEFGVEGEVMFVRDNGAGFEPSQVGRLFTPFQRLHHEDEYEGTGIGLATVQRIVHRHGGRVWAEAEPGEGATFSFTLPRP